MKNITIMKNITTIENTTTEQKSMKNIEIMKNITVMEKTNMQKTAIEKTAMKRITATALLFFFGILFFDDMLSSPRIRTASKKAGLVCGGESLFFRRG